MLDQNGGFEQHAHRHEEQHRERVLQGQRVGGGLVREFRFVEHHAREERAECERHVEQRRGAERDADGQREHREREEPARARARGFSAFLPNHYDNLEKLPRARVPVLVMHGEADELVPFSMGEKLYQAARAPRFFYPIKGAAHNDTYLVGGEKYFQNFEMFARHSRI